MTKSIPALAPGEPITSPASTAAPPQLAAELAPIPFLDADMGRDSKGLIGFTDALRLLAAKPLACERALSRSPDRGAELPCSGALAALIVLVRVGDVPVFARLPGTNAWHSIDSRQAILSTSEGKPVGVAPAHRSAGNLGAPLAFPAAFFVGGRLEELESEHREAMNRRPKPRAPSVGELAQQAHREKQAAEEADRQARFAARKQAAEAAASQHLAGLSTQVASALEQAPSEESLIEYLDRMARAKAAEVGQAEPTPGISEEN